MGWITVILVVVMIAVVMLVWGIVEAKDLAEIRMIKKEFQTKSDAWKKEEQQV